MKYIILIVVVLFASCKKKDKLPNNYINVHYKVALKSNTYINLGVFEEGQRKPFFWREWVKNIAVDTTFTLDCGEFTSVVVEAAAMYVPDPTTSPSSTLLVNGIPYTKNSVSRYGPITIDCSKGKKH